MKGKDDDFFFKLHTGLHCVALHCIALQGALYRPHYIPTPIFAWPGVLFWVVVSFGALSPALVKLQLHTYLST